MSTKKLQAITSDLSAEPTTMLAVALGLASCQQIGSLESFVSGAAQSYLAAHFCAHKEGVGVAEVRAFFLERMGEAFDGLEKRMGGMVQQLRRETAPSPQHQH